MEWRKVKGYEDSYEVSDTGLVRSIDRMVSNGKNKFRLSKGIVLKAHNNGRGYLIVGLKSSSKKVHRLVAEAFIENPYNKREVNHKDGNKKNNNVKNLEWVTSSENIKHSYSIGKREHLKGEKSANKKLNEEKVLEIRDLYKNKKMNKTELAKKFSITRQNISFIINYETWKDVK